MNDKLVYKKNPKNPIFKKFGSVQHLRYISSRAVPIEGPGIERAY